MLNSQACVYRIVNNITDYCYIGSTIDITQRLNNHFSTLRRNKHTNLAFQQDWNSYGANNFTIEIVALYTPKQYTTLTECFKQRDHDTKLRLYNKEHETLLMYPLHYNIARSISTGNLLIAHLAQ